MPRMIPAYEVVAYAWTQNILGHVAIEFISVTHVWGVHSGRENGALLMMIKSFVIVGSIPEWGYRYPYLLTGWLLKLGQGLENWKQ